MSPTAMVPQRVPAANGAKVRGSVRPGTHGPVEVRGSVHGHGGGGRGRTGTVAAATGSVA